MTVSKTSRGVVTCKRFLSQRSAEVTNKSELMEIQQQLSAALDRQTNCVGLCAIQIGIASRVAIYNIPGAGRGFIVNPVIVEKSGSYVVPGGEGCMSLPGVRYNIRRHERIKIVSGIQSVGAGPRIPTSCMVKVFSGFAAAAIQHEIDHMAGITVIDRLRMQRRQGGSGMGRKRK